MLPAMSAAGNATLAPLEAAQLQASHYVLSRVKL